MERIKITEIDNTSNVDSLSSFDVVYVPGFVRTVDSAKYPNTFRNPTLFTTKYQFLQAFGGTGGNPAYPLFPVAQDYPVSTVTKNGFPSYAIPNYAELVVDTENPIDLSTFAGSSNASVMSQVTLYYEEVDRTIPYGNTEPWEPESGVNYFTVTVEEDSEAEQDERFVATVAYSANPAALPLSTKVYKSFIIPSDQGWYDGGGLGGYVKTSDTQIEVTSTSPISIKLYYNATSSTPPMFEKSAPDPGYRYALYLLSLGIPVYFEQMNTPEFIALDFYDWDTMIIKYGVTPASSGEQPYIVPKDHGWFEENNGVFKRTTDTTHYTSYDAIKSKQFFSGADVSVESMYEGLSKRFMGNPDAPDYSFDSIGDYAVKYITTGGYPTFEYGKKDEVTGVVGSGLAESMVRLARARGEALALIDHTNNPDRTIYDSDSLSVIYQVRKTLAIGDIDDSYGAMFTPWYSCTHSAITGENNGQMFDDITMPASLAFLSALSVQLKNYNPWLAVAGVIRGKVPYFGSLHTNYILTNNVADSYQTLTGSPLEDLASISINPITYIRNYGYCIWGNRTLRNNAGSPKATSFLNIRNLVSDIKKTLYNASEELLFSQNTTQLWIDFKSKVTPLLDTMVSNSILSDYKMTKYNIDPDSGDPVPAYKILANIKIQPINSVEMFDLTVQLENNDITVTEEE